MLHEFKTYDSGKNDTPCADHTPGDRDDLGYSAEGFSDAAYNRLLLLQTGYWTDPAEDESRALMDTRQGVGADDLFYKIDVGNYPSYAMGNCRPEQIGSDRVVWARPIFEQIR